MTSFEDVLAKAEGRPESTVSLCLAANLVAQHQQLERDLAVASDKAMSLGEPAPRKAIATRIAELERQMADASAEFRLRAMAPLEWTRFLRTQPTPSKDESEEDWDNRWYEWTLSLVAAVCYEPAMTPEQVGQLVPNLSASQWANLADAAMALNSRRESIPFSAAASALTATSGGE